MNVRAEVQAEVATQVEQETGNRNLKDQVLQPKRCRDEQRDVCSLIQRCKITRPCRYCLALPLAETELCYYSLQRYFDETIHAPVTVTAYLAHPCTRTDLQVRLAWCLMGIKKAEYEASNDSKLREQQLELMEALRALISKDDSAIAWAKRKDALCFVRFVLDRIHNPVLGECIKIIRQKGVDCERNFPRALLELYQDMPLTVPNRESNDMESYRKLEEVRRYSNKELKVNRELI